MDIPVTARQRTIMERFAANIGLQGAAVPARVRSRLISSDEDRKAFVELIEELVAADTQLAEVAPSVGALLRSAIAGEAVTAAFLDAETADVEDAYTPDDVLRISRVRGQAEAEILAQPMLDAAGVAEVMGSRTSNPREYARQLRARPGVLALQVGNRFVFPAFQFDGRRHVLRPLALEINTELGVAEDPWAVASWWYAADPVLGARPSDLAPDESREGDLRSAVAREVAPVG